MARKIIITCAITGDSDVAHKHPDLPVTPEQIAASALEAAEAGAAIVHIHVRDPRTTKGSREVAYYREVVERLASSGCRAIINLTAGMGGKFVVFRPEESDLVDAGERLVHIEALRPDICSLDCGSFNSGRGDEIYVSTYSMIREMAGRIRAAGVKPELEVFDFGQLRIVRELHAEGLLESPLFVQFALGIPWGADADARTMIHLRDALPSGANWVAFGVGAAQMTVAAQSMLLGGHIRVGLEDNLYLSRGVLASNADLVRKAVEIVTVMGNSVASPEEARQILGLTGRA